MKTPQDILTIIADAALNPEREAKVKSLLANLPADQGVDPLIVEEIQQLVQEEIEDGIESELGDEDRAEIAGLQNNLINATEEIQANVTADLKLVSEGLTELEQVAGELELDIDKANIHRIKEDLKAAGSN